MSQLNMTFDTGGNMTAILNPYPQLSSALSIMNDTDYQTDVLFMPAASSSYILLNETTYLNSTYNYVYDQIIALVTNESERNETYQQQEQYSNRTAGKSFWSQIPYEKSGYTQLSIILFAFFFTIIMIIIVVGNLLVCIAIMTEKSLKTIQNWFIASLAVSDLLLGLIIVPFSLAHELMGSWVFGNVWCTIHHAFDVMLTTASINNLCLISLDRYWSITQAVDYLKTRTERRAICMICLVWALSVIVSLPPVIIEMRTVLEPGECELSQDMWYVLYSAAWSFYIPCFVMVFVYAKIFIAARSRARKHVKKKQTTTELTNDPTKEKSTTTTTCTSLSNPSPPDFTRLENEPTGVRSPVGDVICISDTMVDTEPVTVSAPKVTFSVNNTIYEVNMSPADPPSSLSAQVNNNNNVIKQPTRTMSPKPPSTPSTPLTPTIPPSIVIETSESPNNSPTHLQSNDDCDSSNSERRTLSPEPAPVVQAPLPPVSTSNKRFPKLKIAICDSGHFHLPSILRPNGAVGGQTGTNPADITIVSNDDDSDAADSPISKTSGSLLSASDANRGYLATPRLQRSPYGSTMSIADYDDSDLCNDSNDSEKYRHSGKKGKKQIYKSASSSGGSSSGGSGTRHTTSDAERHRRKIAKARERRATLILGLIMGAFIISWLPFFLMYVVRGMCKDCAVMSGLTLGYWLGYSNSAFNPIIYTVFNRDFRKAFRKILFR